MQYICHVLKKLVNCLQYIDTSFIDMAHTVKVRDSKYTSNWGMILVLAPRNNQSRDAVSLTTLQHADRQNPACATGLMATWSLFKKAGVSSLEVYLQAGFLLIALFYDKSSTVGEGLQMAG